MNILKLSRNVAMTLGVVVGAISSAQAVPILTFGQVGQANVVTGTRVGNATTISADNAVVNITQIDAPVGAGLNAFLTFNFENTTPVVMVGPVITQHFSGDFCISSLANCTGTRYLFGEFIDIAFGTGAALVLAASTPPEANVDFESDVILSLGFDRGVGFSFANVTPLLAEVNDTIDSFGSSVSGVFSANIGVAEPETFALLMMGLVAVGLARRRRKPLD